MSPSPEIELYSPELDHGSPAPSTPGESFSGRDTPQEMKPRPNRAPSPPLEADEKGFTETATAVRARGMSLQIPMQSSVEERKEEESPEQGQKRDRELLFGHLHHDQRFGSSPMIKGHEKSLQIDTMQIDDVEMGFASWNLTSPESIDVEDLEMMFTGY